MMWTVVAVVATAIIFYHIGNVLAGMASANRISELEDEIHVSVPIKEVKYYLNQATLPKEMHNSTAWNAALLDVEKWLEGWE